MRTSARVIPVNNFKAGLAQNRRQPGLWLTLESANATEIVAGSGYDWLLLDMEHTSLDVGPRRAEPLNWSFAYLGTTPS